MAGELSSFVGSGFRVKSSIKVWLLSTQLLLGNALVDEFGNFNLELLIPKNLPPGKQILQINGISSQGKFISTSIAINIMALPSIKMK